MNWPRRPVRKRWLSLPSHPPASRRRSRQYARFLSAADGCWQPAIRAGPFCRANPRTAQRLQYCRLQARAGGAGFAGRDRRSLDESRRPLGQSGNPAHARRVQLRRQSRGGGVRLGQGPRCLVGQLDAAGKRLAQPRRQSGPAAELAWPARRHRFYWDESLHGEVRSVFSYAAGPSWTLLWFGLLGMGLLIVFSFSRRSGPVRDLPPPVARHAHRVS